MIPGIPKAIRLLDLEEPGTVPVTLPNGRTIDLHFFDEPGYALLLEAQRTGSDVDAIRALRHALPEATLGEVAILSSRMVTHLTLIAARKIEYVTEVLEGNAGGPPLQPNSPGGESPAAAAASPPQPASRPTRTRTRSRASRAPSARTGGPSPASPTT